LALPDAARSPKFNIPVETIAAPRRDTTLSLVLPQQNAAKVRIAVGHSSFPKNFGSSLHFSGALALTRVFYHAISHKPIA